MIQNYYMEIMSRIYSENFKLLGERLLKQMNSLVTARETIAPVVQKGLFSTKLLSTEPTNFFAIAERSKILNEILSPQPFGNEIYPVESLFRSLYQTLIDAVFAENTFTSNFFQNNELINSIFRLTFKFIDNFYHLSLFK